MQNAKPRRWHFRFLSPVLAVFIALAAAQTAHADNCRDGDPQQVRLQVNASGMRSTEGVITITIYPDDAAHFLNGAYKVARATKPVSLPVTRACIAVPAAGNYAVALFHDANANGHFDTTMLGLPSEGFGFSRNPTLVIGPPKLDAVRFAAHAGDNEIDVKMKYY